MAREAADEQAGAASASISGQERTSSKIGHFKLESSHMESILSDQSPTVLEEFDAPDDESELATNFSKAQRQII